MTVLPKPPRVEKWQRWRNQGAEYVVAETREGAFDRAYFADGQCCSMYDMRASSSWTFLGYVKPDKVEVGQRWRNQWKDYVVEAVSADVANMGGISRASIQAMLTADTFEYLWMAESAPIDGSEAEAAVVDAERITRAIAKALPEPDGAESDRLHAAIHENDKRVPTTKRVDSFGRPMPGTRSVVGPPARDPKTEARRANEEAAKRLIANPPEWAYPKAWTCAVLAVLEWANSTKGPTCITGLFGDGTSRIQSVLRQRFALNNLSAGKVYADHIVAVEAYASGMEHPSSLMGRPGVKGGISTCDLGVDYE